MTDDPNNGVEEGLLVLKPRAAPWAKLLGMIFVALFWNGIVSIFLMQVIAGWRSGRPEWFLALFLIPFVLVGLGFIGGVFYFFLAMFNPRPRLTLSPGAVPLGGALRVQWDLEGRAEALQNLTIYLEGREEAKYRRGTSTHTDTSIFYRHGLAEVTSHLEMRSGTTTATIPAHLMHSFESPHNRILWTIRLHGQIPRWPDLNEEFPVRILPGNRTAWRAS